MPARITPSPIFRSAHRRGPVALVLSALAVSPWLRAQADTPSIELTRKALAEWRQTRDLISREREAWRLGKQSLATSMAVVRREIEALQRRIDEAQTDIGDAQQKFDELSAENAARERAAELLEQRIRGLEDRVQKLLPRVPEPLREQVRPISQRLPGSDAERAKLSLAERYMNAIGVLNQITKWNREVTLTNEVRQVADGSSVSVSVIYLGLGQAYYVGGQSRDGVPSVAGIGSAGERGWTWRQDDALAPAVQQAVAIYKSEQLARLILLPVRIR